MVESLRVTLNALLLLVVALVLTVGSLLIDARITVVLAVLEVIGMFLVIFRLTVAPKTA